MEKKKGWVKPILRFHLVGSAEYERLNGSLEAEDEWMEKRRQRSKKTPVDLQLNNYYNLEYKKLDMVLGD